MHFGCETFVSFLSDTQINTEDSQYLGHTPGSSALRIRMWTWWVNVIFSCRTCWATFSSGGCDTQILSLFDFHESIVVRAHEQTRRKPYIHIYCLRENWSYTYTLHTKAHESTYHTVRLQFNDTTQSAANKLKSYLSVIYDDYDFFRHDNDTTHFTTTPFCHLGCIC